MMTREITPGRWRGLKGTSRIGDRFAILAFDQRGSYRKMLDTEATFDEAVAVKREVVSILSRNTSAVLLDYVYGFSPALELANQRGLLLALEKSGYTGDATYRHTEIEPDWSVRKIKSFGASAIKLLVYYNPAVEKLADELETFVSAVIEEAHEEDITIFLEPLSYSVEASVGKESASFAEKRPWIVVETAKRLSALGPDVLKMEFPVDIAEKYTVREWSAHCEELSEACSVPWVLLSAGVDFDQFVRQLEVAVKSGASGYLAGRAIWKEAVAMEPQERTAFLTGTATRRAERLNEIVDRHAVPWTDFYTYPSTDEQWYTAYRNG